MAAAKKALNDLLCLTTMLPELSSEERAKTGELMAHDAQHLIELSNAVHLTATANGCPGLRPGGGTLLGMLRAGMPGPAFDPPDDGSDDPKASKN
jgi:hypothetical protein